LTSTQTGVDSTREPGTWGDPDGDLPSWAVAAIKRAATDVRMMADLAGDYLFSDYAFERP
jgi:hypothetical protein